MSQQSAPVGEILLAPSSRTSRFRSRSCSTRTAPLPKSWGQGNCPQSLSLHQVRSSREQGHILRGIDRPNDPLQGRCNSEQPSSSVLATRSSIATSRSMQATMRIWVRYSVRSPVGAATQPDRDRTQLCRRVVVLGHLLSCDDGLGGELLVCANKRSMSMIGKPFRKRFVTCLRV